MADYDRLLRTAIGEEPADLLIRSINLINTATRDIYPATIGICEDTIAFVLDESNGKIAEGINITASARQVIDGKDLWASPGLIDSHMHIESTHLTPEYFAAAVVPLGITTVAQDPHEIANVLGKEGVEYMQAASRGLPLRVLTFVPTCVPAVPGLETSGAVFGAEEVSALLDESRAVPDQQGSYETIGLAEVMDYWGVVRRSPRISKIVKAGRERGTILTGHIWIQGERELNTYLAAGIDSDHEMLTAEGILARCHLGMTVEICCARHRDNIEAAVESWKQRGHIENIVFVTDDVPPHELVKEGHLDRGVRRAIQLGMSPVDALRAATFTPARRLRRNDLGLIAPGRKADILIISDLEQFIVRTVITAGKVAAENGVMLDVLQPVIKIPKAAASSVHLRSFESTDFVLLSSGTSIQASVLTQRARGPLQYVTLKYNTGDSQNNIKGVDLFTGVNGTQGNLTGVVDWQSHPDLALVSVWHRHGLNNNRSYCLISGTGLSDGAIASTYAHDSHNLVIIGRNPLDMAAAANALLESGGGYAAVSGGKLLALAALPAAGLLAATDVKSLAADFELFIKAAASLGVVENPLGLITSLPLPVVPAFRPTDMGLVDVEKQEFVPAFKMC